MKFNYWVAQVFSGIRQAQLNKKSSFIVYKTTFVISVLNMLVEQGHILGFSQSQDKPYLIVVYIRVGGPRIILLYTPKRKISVNIYQLKSLHYRDFPNFYMIMTSQGFLTHTEALRRNIGGVLFCKFLYNN